MSTQSNDPQRQHFPPAAVDRVFARLLAMFGAQRMTAAWGDVSADERREVWGAAIARAIWSPARGYDLEAVRYALDELAATETRGPPSSGEFASMCERFAQRPGRQVRSLPGAKLTDEERVAAREQLARIRALVATPARRPAAIRDTARQPGDDDEPVPPAACTCWIGWMRRPTLCPSCAGYGGLRERQEAVKGALR